MRLTLSTIVLACVLPQACSTRDPVGPLGSSEWQRVTPGTLEVTISVTGTRPDPDGYTVAVTVGGRDGPAPRTVGSVGGTVRFPNLPPGTHVVGLVSLAPNCSVQGDNPRQVTIEAGRASQVGLAVFCPGSGAVLLTAVTTGSDPDPDGYSITVEPSTTQLHLGANDSLLIYEKDLAPAPVWVLRLHGIASNCRVTSPNGPPITLRLEGDSTIRIQVAVECVARRDIGIYPRVSPHHSSTISHHGSLSERYVLYADGRFSLQFESARWGFFEYPGSYSITGAQVTFHFDANAGEWQAIGTVRGDCLVVAYNGDMVMSDFEDGEYCRS
jgi:hypothetical protein